MVEIKDKSRIVLFNTVKYFYLQYSATFWKPGQKNVKFFVGSLGYEKTRLFAFKIYWPLPSFVFHGIILGMTIGLHQRCIHLIVQSTFFDVKVHIFWEDHKIFQKLYRRIVLYVVIVKSTVDILQKILAFSEYMNFNENMLWLFSENWTRVDVIPKQKWLDLKSAWRS